MIHLSLFSLCLLCQCIISVFNKKDNLPYADRILLQDKIDKFVECYLLNQKMVFHLDFVDYLSPINRPVLNIPETHWHQNWKENKRTFFPILVFNSLIFKFTLFDFKIACFIKYDVFLGNTFEFCDLHCLYLLKNYFLNFIF